MWLFFFLSIAFVCVAVLYMLAVLPGRTVTSQVKFVVGVSWLTTLIVCCIVPIDVFSTLSSQNPQGIEILWDASYWSTQVLTWALIPVYMGFADAGEFTWAGRMWASLKYNTLFYVLVIVVGCVGLAFTTARHPISLATLPSLGMQLSNTFGLFCVLTLLGYGLVAIPRHLWKRSSPKRELRHQLYKLGRVMEEQGEAQRLLDLSLRKISSTKQALGNSEVQEHQRIDDMLAFIRQSMGSEMEALPSGVTVEQGVEYADELPKLHAEIKRDVSWVGAIQAQAQITTRNACRLSRIVKAGQRGTDIDSGAGDLAAPVSTLARMHRAWQVYGWPLCLKLLALAAVALSGVVLWGEIAVGYNSNLSPLAHLVKMTSNKFLTQLLIMLPLVYVMFATYTALFAINVGSLYAFLPHATSSFSLLFNGNLMTRFAAPLCFNYLHVLSMDRATPDGFYTVFAQRMGLTSDADVAIPFLGTSFNRWAPVIVLIVVALTLVNAFGKFYSWVAHFLPFIPNSYDEEDASDASESSQYVAEGERVVARALRARLVDVSVASGSGSSADLVSLARFMPATSSVEVPLQDVTASGRLLPSALPKVVVGGAAPGPVGRLSPLASGAERSRRIEEQLSKMT